MQMLADMRGVGVKNRGKYEDVLCGWPLFQNGFFTLSGAKDFFFSQIDIMQLFSANTTTFQKKIKRFFCT